MEKSHYEKKENMRTKNKSFQITTYSKYSDIFCEKNAQDPSLNYAALISRITDKWTTKPSKEKNFNQAIYAQATILRNEHNCSAFFISLTLSRNSFSIIEQWKEVADKIPVILRNIKKNFIVAGGILSIEMHKNTSKTNRRGTDSKAGSPQLLFILWITHTILYPDLEQKLRLLFLDLHFEVKMKAILELTDVKRYLLYTIREAADPDLGYFCKQLLQWPATTLIWACDSQCRRVFYQIGKSLNGAKKGYASFWLEDSYIYSIPTTILLKDYDLLNQIFYKWFERIKWALHKPILFTGST